MVRSGELTEIIAVRLDWVPRSQSKHVQAVLWKRLFSTGSRNTAYHFWHV